MSGDFQRMRRLIYLLQRLVFIILVEGSYSILSPSGVNYEGTSEISYFAFDKMVCDPKIIHRDAKAANILLDEDFEAVVGDFGLAKLLDHQDYSHVTTAVRGTVGHIAPEYLSTCQLSEETDVFGLGILLLELITGLKAVNFGQVTYPEGVMLDWVRKLQEDGKLNLRR